MPWCNQHFQVHLIQLKPTVFFLLTLFGLPLRLQYQSRGLVKASGKSSFMTFVDLGMYQSTAGTGDTVSVGSESSRPPADHTSTHL